MIQYKDILSLLFTIHCSVDRQRLSHIELNEVINMIKPLNQNDLWFVIFVLFSLFFFFITLKAHPKMYTFCIALCLNIVFLYQHYVCLLKILLIFFTMYLVSWIQDQTSCLKQFKQVYEQQTTNLHKFSISNI